MTGARKPKRRKGDLFVATVLWRRTVQACARCGAVLCDCRDADWAGAGAQAPTPPVAGEAE